MVPETELDRMRVHIASRSWANLESEFGGACRGPDAALAGQIASVDLADYRGRLQQMLIRASEGAARDEVKAVSWEFDLDNRWASNAFLCRDYRPGAVGDDDWAAEFDPADVIEGPQSPELASLYQGAWQEAADLAGNLYLIARTVATFGTVADEAWISPIPVCAGFHDQTVLFRIRGAP